MAQMDRAHDLFGYRLGARDGVVGRVHDLYFDDRRWVVRYLVVELRSGLSGRRVLISPVCVVSRDPDARRLEVSLSRDQIFHSPDVDADRPVSRQHEVALHEYYGIPFYWADPEFAAPPGADDPHLRSVRAVRGYGAIGPRGALGHVLDFVVDCDAWTLSAVVIGRRHWLAGPRRRVPVSAIARVSWVSKAVYVEDEGSPFPPVERLGRRRHADRVTPV